MPDLLWSGADGGDLARLKSWASVSQARGQQSAMRVSVIIPFSREDLVENTLQSVKSQDYPQEQVEIIVVGQGSGRLAARWGIVAVDEGATPAGRARNLGAKVATGDVLLFIDDDCEAGNDWIIENLRELQGPQVGAVGGMVIGKSSGFFARCVDFSNFSLCQTKTYSERPICTASFGIRKDVFMEMGGFDEGLPVKEDTDICCRLIRAGYKSVYQPRVRVWHNHGRATLWSLLRYQYHNGNASGLAVEMKYQDLYYLFRLLSWIGKPLPYLLAILPLSLLATAYTVALNLKEHQAVLAYSPIIFLGKLACHFGIWRWTTGQKGRG